MATIFQERQTVGKVRLPLQPLLSLIELCVKPVPVNVDIRMRTEKSNASFCGHKIFAAFHLFFWFRLTYALFIA